MDLTEFEGHIQKYWHKLITLIKSSKADGIILLGDIKSHVSRITRLERDSIPPVLTPFRATQRGILYQEIRRSHTIHSHQKSQSYISSGMLLGDICLYTGIQCRQLKIICGKNRIGSLHPFFLKQIICKRTESVDIHEGSKKAIFSDSVGLLEIIIMPSLMWVLVHHLGKSLRKINSPILDRVVKNGDIEEMLYLTLDGSIVPILRLWEICHFN